jgi:hypothetical protein
MPTAPPGLPRRRDSLGEAESGGAAPAAQPAPR